MFGLVHHVLMAERDGRQDQAAKMYDGSRLEAQVWLWRHKALFLGVAGVLALLIVGGNGA